VAHDLLEEERVALGPLEDPAANGVGEVVDRQQQADEPIGVLGVQRIERDRGDVAPAAAPAWVLVEELGPDTGSGPGR
jgi:hypothetical protein